MAVMGYHFNQLRELPAATRCDEQVFLRHATALHTLTADVPAAFPPGGVHDETFEQHLSDFRNAAARALDADTRHCDAMKQAITDIGDRCKACHRDFRG
jgi:cytochrome c556